MVRGNIGLKHSATARPNVFVSLIGFISMSRPSKASTCQRNYGLECDSWSLEKSKCLGCAGNVDVHVAGVGAYNATLSSTCLRTAAQQTCSCNASGIPHRVYKNRLPSVWQEFIFDDNQVAQESYGNWTSTGNCTFDNITGAISPCGGSHIFFCVYMVYTQIWIFLCICMCVHVCACMCVMSHPNKVEWIQEIIDIGQAKQKCKMLVLICFSMQTRFIQC